MAEKYRQCEPYPGCQLRVKRPLFFHHGIYIGNNRVVQFGSGRAEDRVAPADVRVEEVDFDEFCGGAHAEVRVLTASEKRKAASAEEVIARARGRIGEGGYDFFYNNCEHFCNLCIFGVAVSEQAEQLRENVLKKYREFKDGK